MSVSRFLSPQLPLDGSNMNHQTPQLCGVAMQGEEALNPITCYHPKLGPAIPKRDVTMGICTTSNAQEVPPSQLMPIRRGQWFRNDCERRRAATTPSTSWSCQGSFHSLCFKKRTLDPILDFRQPLDVTFPYSLKKLSSQVEIVLKKYNVKSKPFTCFQKTKMLHKRFKSSFVNLPKVLGRQTNTPPQYHISGLCGDQIADTEILWERIPLFLISMVVIGSLAWLLYMVLMGSQHIYFRCSVHRRNWSLMVFPVSIPGCDI